MTNDTRSLEIACCFAMRDCGMHQSDPARSCLRVKSMRQLDLIASPRAEDITDGRTHCHGFLPGMDMKLLQAVSEDPIRIGCTLNRRDLFPRRF